MLADNEREMEWRRGDAMKRIIDGKEYLGLISTTMT